MLIKKTKKKHLKHLREFDVLMLIWDDVDALLGFVISVLTVPVPFKDEPIVFNFPSGIRSTFPMEPPDFGGFTGFSTVILDKSIVLPELDTNFADCPVFSVTFSRTIKIKYES